MSTDTPPARPVAAHKDRLSGWYTTAHANFEAAQRRTTPPAPSKPQKARAPIPTALSKPAPLWLACGFCGLPQLATEEGQLLWHRVQHRGEWVGCTGTNTIGLALEMVGLPLGEVGL